MKKHIKKVIDDWDLIELLSFSPQDEYENEINQIYNFLAVNKNASVKELADIIFNIFLNAFDKNIIKLNKQDYLRIAEKIVTRIETTNKELNLLKLYFIKRLGFQSTSGEFIVYDGEESNENKLVLFSRDLDLRIYILVVDGEYEVTMQGRPTNDLSKYFYYFLKNNQDFFTDPEMQEFIKNMDIEMEELLKYH